MSARLEGHVQGRAASTLACSSERVRLRMRLAGSLVPALSDHHALADENGAHGRIRLHRRASALGELEGSLEVVSVAHATAPARLR